MPGVIMIALLLIMSLRSLGVVEGYVGTVLDVQCSTAAGDGEATSRSIAAITDSLVSGTEPGPPSAYLCVGPGRGDQLPDVWGWASCAEGISKDECCHCLGGAQIGLLYYCPGKAGAHMYRQDCSLQYDSFAICTPK
ncbi:unnamed protein product [Linum trigynum]|uniref:Gnk2-homologous domain-containing protein n=1 Tax=Linum trigynum TaxID=586398 RepID=A0AAV2FYV6_9ROSI